MKSSLSNRWKFIVAACMVWIGCHAAEIEVHPNGSLKIAGMTAFPEIATKDWIGCNPAQAELWKTDAGYPRQTKGKYESQGWTGVPGTPGFKFTETVTSINDNKADLSIGFVSNTPAGEFCNRIYFLLQVPAGELEGKGIRINDRNLPFKADETQMGGVRNVSFVHDGKEIVISGNFSFSSCVNYGFASLRFGFTPFNEMISRSDFKCTIEVKPLATSRLDLRQVAGAVSGDALGKRYGLPASQFKHGDISFDTRAFLKIGAGQTVKLPVATGARHLYLLHNATAQTKPVIQVKSGEKSRIIELAADRDYSTERPHSRCSNSAVAEISVETFEGVDFTHFDLNSKNVTELALTNSGSAEWLVAGITLTDVQCLPQDTDSYHFDREGKEWMLSTYKVPQAGSILDFSFVCDAPAGKYGRVIVNENGHFSFEKAPKKYLRMFGTNLSFDACFPKNHAMADQLASEVARAGYNAIRFHHFDGHLLDQDGNVIPEMFEKLDYLFAAMKNQGLYITIDLFAHRALRGPKLAALLEKYGNSPNIYKNLAPLAPEILEELKTFSENLLSHKNPYTGMTWAEDPALFGVDLINEANATFLWNHTPELKSLYAEHYYKYLQEKGIDTPENRSVMRGTKPGEPVYFTEFMTSLDHRLIAEMSAKLRNLGFKGVITQANFLCGSDLTITRDPLQWIDVHAYNDHPSNYMMPMGFNQHSSLKAMGHIPRLMMSSRIFGRPFTSTEISFCFPNQYRGEFGPVVGAYAGLQDWDGLFRFEWANLHLQVEHNFPIAAFDTCNDINSQAADRVAALLFLQNRVKSAKSAVAIPYGLKTEQKRGTENLECQPINQLGLFCRVGSLREGLTQPGVTLLSGDQDQYKSLPAVMQNVMNEKQKITSETGEITIDSKGSIQVVTPTGESLALEKGTRSGNILQVSNVTPTFHVVSAFAMDGKKLTDSNRILVIHQTDATSRYLCFRNEKRQLLNHPWWGERKNQLLIRRGAADVSLKLGNGDFLVQAIGFDGMPSGTVESSRVDGKLAFRANTDQFGGTFYYLVERR